jgi:hypothetical protein
MPWLELPERDRLVSACPRSYETLLQVQHSFVLVLAEQKPALRRSCRRAGSTPAWKPALHHGLANAPASTQSA